MSSRRALVASAIAVGACALPSVAQADDQSFATVAINGAKAVAVQESQFNLALSKAAQDPSMRAGVAEAGDRLRESVVLLALAAGQETPSTDTGRQAKNKLLDALRKEYEAVGTIDDLIATNAKGASAKQRLKTAIDQLKKVRREALAAGKLLRQIVSDAG